MTFAVPPASLEKPLSKVALRVNLAHQLFKSQQAYAEYHKELKKYTKLYREFQELLDAEALKDSLLNFPR